MVFCSEFAAGQVPAVTRIDTTTLRPGQHAVLTIHGSGLKNPQRVWTPFAEFRPVSGHDVNADAAVAVEGDVAATVVPGVYPVRVITAQACSSAAMIVVDDLPAHTMLDGSEVRGSAPVLALPCCVASQVNPAKSRFFRMTLTAGQTVTLDVLARRMNSALDPVLRVFSPSGTEVGWCDNIPGTDGDARVIVTAAEAGDYLIQIHDVKYAGGAAHFFHLRAGTFPAVASTSPRVIAEKSSVGLLGTDGQVIAEIPASSVLSTDVNRSLDGTLTPISWKSAPEASGAILTVLRSHGGAMVEVEPNDQRDQAGLIPPETRLIAGRFQKRGDEDWYRIHVDAAASLCVTSHTRDVGSASDLVLRLFNADGGKITEVDDYGSLDGQLTSALPAAGDYFLRVSDLAGKSGLEWTYDLELDVSAGRLEVTAPADLLNVPRGANASLLLTVRRVHFDGPVLLSLQGLPASLKSEPVWLGSKQTIAALTLTSTDAKPDAFDDDAGPLVVTASAPENPAVAISPVMLAPRASKAVEPFRNAILRTDFFTAISPAVPYSLSVDSVQVTVAAGASVTVPVKALRTADWTFPIELALATPADQLPAGITVTGASMAATDAVITIAAAADAPAGKFTLFAQGTSKKDDKNIVVQPLPSVTVTVTPAVAAEAAK
jgi:hypothetical protein